MVRQYYGPTNFCNAILPLCRTIVKGTTPSQFAKFASDFVASCINLLISAFRSCFLFCAPISAKKSAPSGADFVTFHILLLDGCFVLAHAALRILFRVARYDIQMQDHFQLRPLLIARADRFENRLM